VGKLLGFEKGKKGGKESVLINGTPTFRAHGISERDCPILPEIYLHREKPCGHWVWDMVNRNLAEGTWVFSVKKKGFKISNSGF